MSTKQKSKQDKKESTVQSFMRQTVDELARDPAARDDAAIDLDQEAPRHGPHFVRASQGATQQAIIDELLINCRPSQGYYMKLKKYVDGGNWIMLHRFDKEYETWTDLEWELTRVVREMTKKYGPARWGTGTYRVEFFNDRGQRGGPRYDPQDFLIDAAEEPGGPAPQAPLVDPKQGLMDSVGMFTQMATAMKALQPESKNGTDPALLLILNKLLDRSPDTSQGLWTVLIPAIAPILKDLLVRRGDMPEYVAMIDRLMALTERARAQEQKPKSLLEQLTELRTMGLDPFPKRKELTDVASDLRSAIDLVNSLKGFTGGEGGEPSITAMISANLGKILETIQTLATTGGGGTAPPPLLSAGTVASAGPIGGTPTGAESELPGGAGSAVVDGIPVPPGTNPALVQIVHGIMTGDVRFYPVITDLLRGTPQAGAVLNDLKRGTLEQEDFLALLRMYTKYVPGGEMFRHPAIEIPLRTFLAGYLAWMRATDGGQGPVPVTAAAAVSAAAAGGGTSPSASPILQEGPAGNGSAGSSALPRVGECTLCGALYDYPSEEAYIAERAAHNGTNPCGRASGLGATCVGTVQLRPVEVGL